MIAKLKLICCLLFAGIVAVGATPLHEANKKFSAGDFTAAVVAYEKIIADHGPDAAVFYNLGNSYQSLKQYGPAILAYERARVISPRDPDLLANLALARKAANVFEETRAFPWLEPVLQFFSRDDWSWIIVGAAFVFGCCGLIFAFLKNKSFVGIVAGCAVLVIVVGSVALYLRRGETGCGIVLTEQAVVRLSPFSTAESLGNVGAGKVALLGEEKAGFHYVEIEGTSLRGWLAAADVSAIIPKMNP